MPGYLRGRHAVHLGQLAGGVRAAGQIAAQPHPHGVGQRRHPQGQLLDRGRGGELGGADRVVQHRLPAVPVQHHQVRPAQARRDEQQAAVRRGRRPLAQLVDGDPARRPRRASPPGDTAVSASARPLCRRRSVLWRASAASWWRSRDQVSAKNASSQSSRNCRSQARIRGGSASSRSAEPHLLRPARGGQVQRAAAHLGVGERRPAPCASRTAARR